MRNYELILVLRPSLKEADKKKVLDSVKGWLGELKIVKDQDLGTKTLSYPIKKETTGIYLSFDLEGENVPSDLEKRILGNDNIIRHLLLRTK